MVRTLFVAASVAGLLPTVAVRAQNPATVSLAPASTTVANQTSPVAGVIDVTTSNALAPDFIQSIARLGLPSELTLQKDQTVRSVIEARCGIVSPAYVAVFLEENASRNPDLSAFDLETPAPGKVFAFPFCVRPPTIQEPMQSTVSSLYDKNNLILDSKALTASASAAPIPPRSLGSLRLFGSKGVVGSNSGFVSTELSRKFQRDNPNIDPKSISSGTSLFITAPETTATVPLRSSKSLGDAQKSLSENLTPGIANGARVANLIGDEKLVAGECEGVIDVEWPFPSAALKQALQRVADLRPPNIDRPDKVKVMTVDTGFDPAMGMPAIDSATFGYLSGPGSTDLMDRIGMNANDPAIPDAVPLDGLKQRLHGSEVAATLVGGSYLQRLPPIIKSPRLSFVSIAAVNASGAPYLDIGGIGEAILIAARSDVRIVNASVSADARRDSFLKIVANDQRMLIVAAAGNSRLHPEFDEDDLPWPGSMGGERSNAENAVIVSVGAHDPSGNILAFSRFGPQVDLLAPGCRIPTYTLTTGQVEKVERSGTSFAAPLVSLVASQMVLEGLSPAQIKERLIVSADVDERIALKSYSGGRLNAVTALSLWHDVVAFDKLMQDGTRVPTLVIGKLGTPFKKLNVCGRTVDHNKLRKLVLSRMPETLGTKPPPGKWRGWATISGKLQKIEVCPEASDAVSGDRMEIVLDDGSVESIDLSSIRNFTARFK